MDTITHLPWPDAENRVKLQRIAVEVHERIALLRCQERTQRADREMLLVYIEARIQSLDQSCNVRDSAGAPTGWTDPDDIFTSGHQLRALHSDLEELLRGPYPLGELPADAFAAGRLYNGKMAS